jgi:hypothetical protein
MLNHSSVASNIAKKLREIQKSDKYDENILLKTISKELDVGFQQATPTLTNFLINAPANTLDIPNSPGITFPKIIGLSIADYWSKTITPGPPIACPVVSVINNAITIAPIIEAKLLALTQKKQYSEPYYEEFVKIIFDAVKTIQWVVVETLPPYCGNTYTGNVT